MVVHQVAWYPFCDQGWVNMVKEISSNKLYLCCAECETQWIKPSKNLENECLPFDTFGKYTNSTIEEIKENNWEKFIL